MKTLATIVSATALFAAPALAFPVNGTYFDDPTNCDNHGSRLITDEIGTGVLFPTTCSILASWAFTQVTACPLTDNTSIPNVEIRIVNTSGRSWTDLFYVGNVETSFSNYDGFGVSTTSPAGALGLAVKLDHVGGNTPLILESGVVDGIFSPFETWVFVLQDWTNGVGFAPDMFDSLDFAGFSMISSGSIVATIVPTPGALASLAAGGLIAIRRRRSL